MKRETSRIGKSIVFSFLPFLFLCAALPASIAAQSRGISLRIDDIRTENFLQKNQIVFYIDLLAADLSVVPKLESDTIKVFIKDRPKPLEGSFIIQSFSKIHEPVAIVIVFAAHQDFIEVVRNEKGEESIPLELVKQGVINFLGQLDGIDKVAIYQYNETGKEKIFPFSNVSNNAADNVRNFAKGREFDEGKKKEEVSYPAFYKHLLDIIEKDIGEEPNLPRRKIMLVISDGMDKNISKVDSYVKKIIESANYLKLKIYSVGYTPSDKKSLIPLQSLSNKTKGVYREPPSIDSIPLMIENIADEIKKQYVVTFTTDDLDGGRMYSFRMTATVQGQYVEGIYDEEVKLEKKPFPFLKWTLIIVGGIVGIVILYLLIRWIAAYAVERKRRREEEAARREEYTGPSKGTLRVTSGEYAGEVFHLVDNSCSIGRLNSNSICIPDPSVSKKHAVIQIKDMLYEINDLNSTSGVYVNGRKILKQYLKDGDTIRIGNTEMIFNIKKN